VKDKYGAWGFFDGPCKGIDKTSELVFILHFLVLHYVVGKANLGQGTNNLGEFKDFISLLKYVV
jgi:hypothetical protein